MFWIAIAHFPMGSWWPWSSSAVKYVTLDVEFLCDQMRSVFLGLRLVAWSRDWLAIGTIGKMRSVGSGPMHSGTKAAIGTCDRLLRSVAIRSRDRLRSRDTKVTTSLFGDLEGNGFYYGSDAVRSPYHFMRNPGEPEYDGVNPFF